MADDIMWLSHQLRFGEARGVNKLIVEVSQAAFGVGLRNDQSFVGDRIVDGRDGKIGAHGRAPTEHWMFISTASSMHLSNQRSSAPRKQIKIRHVNFP